MTIRLSPRLRCIADFVRRGDRVVDVGTDHAYIPIWLLQTGISTAVYATDIREGPLANAAGDAAKYGVSDRLRLNLCDGLSGCAPDEVDTVILAGMGGETIIGILEAAPWALEKRLILQPQTKQQELRRWLQQHSLAISDASLVYDTGRIYLVWLVASGNMKEIPAVDRPLLEKRDPLLRPYAEAQIKRLRKQIHGMEQARAGDPDALEALKSELNEYLNVLEVC